MPPLVALFAWPAISIFFFQKMRGPLAILVTMIAGYLLLPEKTAVDLPILPALDKSTVPILTACLLIALMAATQDGMPQLTGILPKSTIVRLATVILLIGAFMTAQTNGDTVIHGDRILPGLGSYDGFAEILRQVMVLLPLFLARKYLAHPSAHRQFLMVLCFAGAAYAFLALIEIRLSPQFNNWVYGFFPHSFAQHVRGGGGYRPLVFLGHGLRLAIFLSATILAALALFRISSDHKGRFGLIALWLFGTLVLAKSLGALLITMALIPVVLMLRTRSQLLVALILGGLVLTYPVMRASNVMPLDQINAFASSIDETRAASLRTRLDNEAAMLTKAQQRPVFGWGGWGRSRVYDERGYDITIADGYWIIALSVGGWVRYAGEFLLLTVPFLFLFLRSARYRIGAETAALALILAANLVDIIPNSSIIPLTWLMAGALWGRLELGDIGTAPDEGPVSDAAPGPRREVLRGDQKPSSPGSTYTRQTQRISRKDPTPRSPVRNPRSK